MSISTASFSLVSNERDRDEMRKERRSERYVES
jgi:hypothetical protein